MHGILGSKKNFRTAAKQIITEKFHFDTSVTLDHRGHGNSTIPPILEGTSLNTVSSCAEDIHHLFSQQHMKLIGNTPMVLCGHSFGGKVALMYLQHCIVSGRPLPRHIWILDSIPGLYDKSLDSMQKHDSSVTYVLESVRRLYAMPSDVFRSKESVVQALLSRDISNAMVQWIATNLVPEEDIDYATKAKRVRFSFDINTIVDLFDDFCGLDMWDFVHDFAR